MQVIDDALHAQLVPRGVVVTIGNYDGIHRGQRRVLDLVRARASETGLDAAVVTFDPHPVKVLHPDSGLRLLTTRAQKEALLDEAGVDHVLIVRFTPEFSRIPARTFVRDFLHERLDAREIYVGSRFAFGHRRSGDLSLLRQMGDSFGFSAFAVDEVRHLGEPVSSSRIRTALLDGEVALARDLLGRPYSMVGLVARGDRLGTKLGWPTVNVASDNELMPKDGVYACQVRFGSSDRLFEAVTNIGTRPTVYDTTRRVLESHVLEFDSDVYGERVELGFLARLRDERKFPSMMELAAQIGRDVENAKQLFARLEVPTPSGSEGHD